MVRRGNENVRPEDRIHLAEMMHSVLVSPRRERASRALSSCGPLEAGRPLERGRRERRKGRKIGRTGVVDSGEHAGRDCVTNADRVRGRADKTRSCLGASSRGWKTEDERNWYIAREERAGRPHALFCTRLVGTFARFANFSFERSCNVKRGGRRGTWRSSVITSANSQLNVRLRGRILSESTTMLFRLSFRGKKF